MKEQILAVQRMQDYIETHLDEKIGLSELSQVSLFSPWYSYRIFQEYTGMTPAHYIRRFRLTRAALRLKKENNRIIDTAFDLGFGSVDGFTRAFNREFGMCPSDYAANPVPITLFVPYGAKFRALRKDQNDMKKTNNIFIQVIHKPERKVLCKRGVKAEDYFPYCEEVGCDVWGMLLSMDSLCGEPVCLWLPEQYKKPNTSTYVQGVEVSADYVGPVPEGFEAADIPPLDYAVCYLRDKEGSPDFYSAQTHEACLEALRTSGMTRFEDNWCFERYQCPRFTTPDEQGNVILDYGIAIL